ncbi:hypothetical protein [Thalassotalea agarivorans]|uniref:Uncharacterized protein n=1 Tax=Thalassotalea agarivorans TaxID=349064 RepID=A0A1I0FL18_THASX|nr:hypothetical protein [Thalassotalea agarivorans]SET58904.1 hypothetical protein SAMN05660429_02182 [Thalassotalea agarivorans]
MAIKTITSDKLQKVWMLNDLSVLPFTYAHQVLNILFDLDAAYNVDDLADIGAVQYLSEDETSWAVTITVNNVEPCGAITCIFWQGDCYNVDIKEYNA